MYGTASCVEHNRSMGLVWYAAGNFVLGPSRPAHSRDEVADPCSSRATEDGTGLPHRSLQRLLPAALLTCVVALYNHFPLTYPDTGGYFENAFALAHGRAPWFFYRPLTYGAFLMPFATPLT